MAAPKIIPYQVKLRSTTIERSISRPVIYTNDLRSAEFQFKVIDMEPGELSSATATTLLYMEDGSFFQNKKEDVNLSGTTFSYLLKENEGNHAGISKIQLVVCFNEGLENEQNFPTQLYEFEITSGLENKVAVEVMIQDWTTLTREARTFIDTSADEVDALKDELQTAINTANASLGEFDVALETGIVAANLAEKLEDFEEINNSRLLSTERQLADTLNKSAIKLTHMFADNTSRDAYFVAHPAELVDLQFIKVGTTYQQYIEGVWTDSVPIVAEQVNATNQPIVDTGNYFATDKTNDALQELGAHKASTANPHGVTKSQVGLGNVDNTSDANKPVSTAQQTALNAKANKVQEAWITPTLVNGWTSTDFAYMRDEFGFVHFRGILDNPTYNTYFCTLPIDYCPSKTMSLCVISIDTTSNVGTPVQILITQYGTMWLYSTATKPLIMNNVSFRVVQ